MTDSNSYTYFAHSGVMEKFSIVIVTVVAVLAPVLGEGISRSFCLAYIPLVIWLGKCEGFYLDCITIGQRILWEDDGEGRRGGEIWQFSFLISQFPFSHISNIYQLSGLLFLPFYPWFLLI